MLLQVAALRAEADGLGLLLQYGHQGFLHNKRQQRMGGLAILELAQVMAHVVRIHLHPPL